MSALHRPMLLALALAVVPATVAATIDTNAEAAPPKKDPLADKYAGHIFFYASAPPATVGGPGWFAANKISKRDENSDKKWVLHMMIFLKKPLDVNKIDLKVYKTDKKGNTEYVQTLEQFPSGDGRSFYFMVTLTKGGAMEPNLKYTLKASTPSQSGGIAEGDIELDGKEEKIGGSDLDFTKGDLAAPSKDDGDAPKSDQPFDASYAKDQLKAVIYEDCKTTNSNGPGKVLISLDPKTGKAVHVEFAKDPAPKYEPGAMKCVTARFEKVKVKPFSGDMKVIGWNVSF